MIFNSTKIEGCYVIESSKQEDERGWFARLYDEKELEQIGFAKHIAQSNISYNKKKGTLRGLHYQLPPYAETKIIRCLHGEVWDIAVDLRSNSKTFLQWISVTLNSGKGNAILIPQGFAHGFVTLTDDAELLYMHSEFYHVESERGIHHLDVRLQIQWPIQATVISKRDAALPKIDQAFSGIDL